MMTRDPAEIFFALFAAFLAGLCVANGEWYLVLLNLALVIVLLVPNRQRVERVS
jgi:hypothetical protein